MIWVRLSALLLAIVVAPAGAARAAPALIPMPASVADRSGEFLLGPATVIEASGKAEATAAYLSQALGLKAGKERGPRIRLSIVPASAIPGAEAYHLSVKPGEIRIEASDPRGLFYGAQTLRQLVARTPSGAQVVKSTEIRDAPRFKFRGLLIDVGRHFFDKQAMLRIIDEMASYKLNVLHLHLTDYQGWRIEIPGFPKLTEVGSKVEGPGFFTTEDISAIVKYAGDRHIMVVPEIEMPGHAGAAAKAYPQFFDTPSGTFNPARPETYDFIRAVLTQVTRLFPAPYLHFGGDEVGDETWKDNPDVIRLKAEQGFTTTDEVDAFFGKKVAAIITELGKKPMAWDEQAESGAASNVVIQWWRRDKPEVLEAAAKGGYELVMSPADHLYFDYPQGPGEPGAPWEGNKGGPQSIAKMLAWEPVPASFTAEEESRVLGIEAAVWTEFIETERYLQFMTFPRMLALAEIGWRPKGPRDEKEFTLRLEPHIEALRGRGINARRGEWDAYEFITN